nr:hypothetical protein DFIBIBGI_00201 [Escherichia coli]
MLNRVDCHAYRPGQLAMTVTGNKRLGSAICPDFSGIMRVASNLGVCSIINPLSCIIFGCCLMSYSKWLESEKKLYLKINESYIPWLSI